MAVALPGGDAIVMGGYSSLSPLVIESSVEYFHGATATWTISPAPLPIATADAGVAYFRARGEILITGGLHPGGGGAPFISTDAIRYRPSASMPAASSADYYNAPRFARYEHTVTLLPGPDLAPGTADDMALIYGGSGQDPSDPPTQVLPGQVAVHSLHVLGDAEVFDPTVGFGRWHQVNDNIYYRDQQQLDPASSVLGPRRQHAAVALVDGTVLLVGGHSQIDADVASGAPELFPVDDRLRFAERFFLDPVTPSLSVIDPAGQSAFMRVLPRATLLACGDVLVSGGYDYQAASQPVIATMETYDPSLITPFAPADDLLDGRWLHGATRLQDNRVLIVGGEGGDAGAPFPLASSELYQP
jgi:hypothetical protein